ncbi:TolB family protein [Candidatus Neomarinimicrobiota bacterium]
MRFIITCLVMLLIAGCDEPDSNKGFKDLLFAAELSGEYQWQVAVMDLDDDELHLLTDFELGVSNPSFSPDASMIVFDAIPDGGNHFEIYTMKANGHQLTRLTYTDFPDYATNFGFSPDGSKIVYTDLDISGRYEDSEIYIMDAYGSNSTRITEDDAHISWVQFNPLY